MPTGIGREQCGLQNVFVDLHLNERENNLMQDCGFLLAKLDKKDHIELVGLKY